MISSYLVFNLAGRLFGAKMRGAIEILPWRKSRRIPRAFPYVEGVIDYRGTIYPVFNLAQRLGLSMAGHEHHAVEQAGIGQSIILLEEKKTPFGIVADGVAKMAMLEEAAIHPEKDPGVDPRYVKGIGYENEQEIVILDFERLFDAG